MYLELNLPNAVGGISYSVVDDTIVVHEYSYESINLDSREVMEPIDFFYIEKPKGHNKFMLFPKFENMPQNVYCDGKNKLLDIQKELNEKLNAQYNKENRPALILHKSTPKQFTN